MTPKPSQLASLLDAEPIVTTMSRRLRRTMREGPTTAQSHEKALASLKKAQEEDNAKRLAARPAVDLLQVLPRTCYREKIKLEKWSEKVAALEALIASGGVILISPFVRKRLQRWACWPRVLESRSFQV